ncbi:MAG: hypothetical protein F4246_05790 [Rhodothermaceae bacterium]|nr:hypothetical protein [Rhodothermaceae bacterium]MXX59061.1 hypothetical protein [Rhodothermaceae bacterium]MYD18399.1 hypothetical protein [Rhodothermaceae bacterium]MYD56506.1 hypothetical protein [Rhodothermaceae bacterium]MYI43972.1 hypothetical protein [Rhodothermaceae bacterium]
MSGRLWKPTDGGTTWHFLSDYLPKPAVVIQAIGASNRDFMYVGTGEGFGGHAGIVAVAGSGVFKSTDQGRTRTHLNLQSSIPALDGFIAWLETPPMPV